LLIESVLCTWYWPRIAVMHYRKKSSNLLRTDDCVCAISISLRRRFSDVACILMFCWPCIMVH
jgi:hypothetical protein